MRILFLSHRFYPDVGGIEVNSEILANAFREAGHEVRLVTWSRGNGTGNFAFPVSRNPGLWSLVRHHSWADIVYENNPCLRLSWPAIFLGKPGVIAIRAWLGGQPGKTALPERLKRHWLRRARSVIAVSDAIRRACWPPAYVIHNPYRVDLFRNTNAGRGRNSFVFLGRLVSDKGADLAIKAFAMMLRQRTEREPVDPFLLTIAGDGPDLEQLKRLAMALGIPDQVRFTGMLRDGSLVECLNAHSFLLVPSLCEEAFGNVVLEGMACGCIPIVSDRGGLPEAVGDAGLVFPRGDVQALMRCMLRLVNDPVLERKLRSAAPAHLAEHHPAVVAGRYLEVVMRACQ